MAPIAHHDLGQPEKARSRRNEYFACVVCVLTPQIHSSDIDTYTQQNNRLYYKYFSVDFGLLVRIGTTADL